MGVVNICQVSSPHARQLWKLPEGEHFLTWENVPEMFVLYEKHRLQNSVHSVILQPGQRYQSVKAGGSPAKCQPWLVRASGVTSDSRCSFSFSVSSTPCTAIVCFFHSWAYMVHKDKCSRPVPSPYVPRRGRSLRAFSPGTS